MTIDISDIYHHIGLHTAQISTDDIIYLGGTNVLSRIVGKIKEELPKFNDSLIVDLRRNEVNNLVHFVGERYRECSTVADENLKYLGYQILSPIERVNYELTSGMKKNIVNINEDEAVLVNYLFSYHDREFIVSLYVPYLYEDSKLVVSGTHYECLLSMTEKLFSVRADNGITIKLIRSPISCYRNTLHAYVDEVTKLQFVGNIVSCKLYYKKSPKTKKSKPTVIHYLLCKFTLPEVLVKFGLESDATIFTEHEEFDEEFYYFRTKNSASAKEQIYLKVRKDLMDNNRLLADIVSAIIYAMCGFRFINYQELIKDSRTIFMIILGKLIYSNSISHIQALSYMVKHIESVDSYLDNYTREIFKSNGIIVNDIYELLTFVAINISQIIISCPNNNMYNKRLEAINNVIIDNLVRSVNSRIYQYERKPDIDHMFKSIVKSLKVSPRFILKTLGSSDSVRFSPGIYSDNWLLSVGDKIVKRLSASVKPAYGKRGDSKAHGSGINASVNKFHPSMLVVESAIGFSSKPGANCLINPYAKIDEGGGFIRDEFAEETAIIQKYLANEQTAIQD